MIFHINQSMELLEIKNEVKEMIKVFIGIIVVLLTGLTVLGSMYKGALEEIGKLEVLIETCTKVNEDNVKEIESLNKDKIILEDLYKEQKRSNRKGVLIYNNKLTLLRGISNDTCTRITDKPTSTSIYLNTPVPSKLLKLISNYIKTKETVDEIS